MPNRSKPVTHCRCCGSSDLFTFLDLGVSPIANNILPLGPEPVQEYRYPLDVAFCRGCSLVQLAHDLPANAIFTNDYPYFSSYSDEICQSAKRHTTALMASRHLNAQSFVVEVASNDGYLLRNLKEAGVRVLGVEPSPGPARVAVAAGIPTEVAFFGKETAHRLVQQHGQADVIVANNVMAHVPDLDDFVGGFAILLADDGVLTIENASLVALIQNAAFDTIYHEHYCYFSCMSVDVLVRRQGLYLNDVEYLPNMHGGSLRWFIGKQSAPTPRLLDRLEGERAAGLGSESYYATFGATVTQACAELKAMLLDLKGKGSRIAAYGAAAKGCTLLNSLGIGTDVIDYVVDKNVHKQNHLMPGSHLPIVDPKRLHEDPVDYLLLLAWNYKDEIRVQQAAFAQGGGRFIVPLPHPVVL